MPSLFTKVLRHKFTVPIDFERGLWLGGSMGAIFNPGILNCEECYYTQKLDSDKCNRKRMLIAIYLFFFIKKNRSFIIFFQDSMKYRIALLHKNKYNFIECKDKEKIMSNNITIHLWRGS